MITKTNYYNLIASASFAIVGIILNLFFKHKPTNDGTNGPATTSIWGYGMVGAGVLGLMFITFALTTQLSNISKHNSFAFVKKLFQNSFPTLLLLSIVTWLLTINIIHYKKINKGHVANEYNTFSTLSTIVIIIQVFVVLKFMIEQFDSKQVTNTSEKYSSLNYILTLGNIIIVGIMTIILSYFSTDG
jgi:hypothetical protein